MEGAHDLGGTPSLVDTQVGHNVGSLEAAVGVSVSNKSAIAVVRRGYPRGERQHR